MKTFYPFDAGAGSVVTEAMWTKMAKHWLPSGVLDGELNKFAVTTDGSGRDLQIASGRAWLSGHFFESDAQETVTLDANATGGTRIDRVVIRLDWTANTIDFAVLTGAAGGAVPALTQSAVIWEIPLAQIAVANGAVNIVAADITDQRTYAANQPLSFSVLARIRSDSQAVNTTLETVLLNETIKGGTLGTDGVLELEAGFWILNNTGAAVTFKFRVRFGTAEFASGDISVPAAGAASRNVRISFRILNVTASSQRTQGELAIGGPAGNFDFENDSLFVAQQVGAATQDTSTDKQLQVTVQMGTASLNAHVTRKSALLTRLNSS